MKELMPKNVKNIKKYRGKIPFYFMMQTLKKN